MTKKDEILFESTDEDEATIKLRLFAATIKAQKVTDEFGVGMDSIWIVQKQSYLYRVYLRKY